ncbi:MAG: hypothetical protein Q7K44_03140 [Candidatus Liptonbacteria bacterium]|nr:hypothetical protein [Candidatus Liptonbacteria bacterium]
MTANQQLKDYIAEQTKLGVSKDMVKSALLGAGWKEDDINQAVTEAESGPQEIAPLKPASLVQPIQQIKPAQSAQQTQSAQPAKSTEVSQAFKPVNMPGSFSTAAKDSPVSFITSDIFKPKSEPVFQSLDAKSKTSSNSPEAKPQVISMTQNDKSAAGMGDKILTISLGVVSIILLGGNVYFFLQNGGLRSNFDSLNNGKASSESQIASLTTDKKNLTDEVGSLSKIITDLNSQISIFAVPADSSSTTVSFDVVGMLGGGGKSLYSLTTSKNIVLFVKNSKDADVESVLKSLTGKQVGIGGTHQPESTQLTVTTVNGQPVLGAAKVAAAAAAAAAAAVAAQVSASSSTQSSGQTSTSTPETGTATSTP